MDRHKLTDIRLKGVCADKLVLCHSPFQQLFSIRSICTYHNIMPAETEVSTHSSSHTYAEIMIGEESGGGGFTYLKREKKLRGSKRFSQVFRPRTMSVHRSRPAGKHKHTHCIL